MSLRKNKTTAAQQPAISEDDRPSSHSALTHATATKSSQFLGAIRRKASTILNKNKVGDLSALALGNSDKGGLQVVSSSISQIRSTAGKFVGKWRAKSTTNAIYTLAPFMPKLFKDSLRELDLMFPSNVVSPQQAYKAVARNMRASLSVFHGAVMLADITGFTQMTERLSKKGTIGVELLTKCMNSFFSKVIELVMSYDGDVIKFAGDCLIVAFSPTNEELALTETKGLTEATLRCVQCACQLTETLGQVQMLPDGEVVPIAKPSNHRWRTQKNYIAAAKAFKSTGHDQTSSPDYCGPRRSSNSGPKASRTIQSVSKVAEVEICLCWLACIHSCVRSCR